jgi:hypothetical protein
MRRNAPPVSRGLCPHCGVDVSTPAPVNRCPCGKWVVNQLGIKFRGVQYLATRRALNKPRPPTTGRPLIIVDSLSK